VVVADGNHWFFTRLVRYANTGMVVGPHVIPSAAPKVRRRGMT